MKILIISLNSIFPLFIMITLGYTLKKFKVVTRRAMNQMNRMSYLIFIPILLFYNIYKTNLKEVIQPRLILFAISSVLIIWGIAIAIGILSDKTPRTRGAMIQGIYRSNFTLYGLPIVIFLFGESNAGITSFLIAIIVPMFNIMAIITLEFFKEGKVNFNKIFLSTLKNPLMIGSLAGIISLLLHIRLPVFLESSLNALASLAIPLSLIAMGSNFTLMTVKTKKIKIALAVIVRIVIIPLIFLPISILLGFRDIELASLMALFASPTAIVSYPMAVQMDSDSDFACAIVTFTTLFSVFTVFIYILLLQYGSFITLPI